MARRYWLIKSEPFKYAWDELVDDGKTYWDGVRNYEARNNLRDMKLGDLALYYHSNEGKEVVGVARICGESYPDPTADDPQWLVVDVEPVVVLERPVTLQEIKADPALQDINLVRRGRLSVVPIDRVEFDHILRLGETRLPGPDGPPAQKMAPKPAKEASRKQSSRTERAGRKGAVRKSAAKKKKVAGAPASKRSASKKRAAKNTASRKRTSKKSASNKAARKRAPR